VRTNTKALARAIAEIDEEAWVDIAYPVGGKAQVAECIYCDDETVAVAVQV